MKARWRAESFVARLLVLVLVLGIGSACSPEPERAQDREIGASEPLVVYAVNEPLRYFAERIGGGEVTSVFPAPASIDPALWSPSAESVAAYQSADLVLLNGASYAPWISRVTLSRRKQVDTSAAFADRLILRQGGVTHGHGPSGTHSHVEAVGEVWLDPELALAQALAVMQALSRARPAAAAGFEAAFLALEADLRALDLRLERASTSLRDGTNLERSARAETEKTVGFAFSHPVYAYLERRYGLHGLSLHWEPDQPPSENQWSELEQQLARQPAAWMLWEAAPLPDVARRLRTLGVQVIVYRPAANLAAGGDWLEVMQRNAGSLEAAAAAKRVPSLRGGQADPEARAALR